MSIKTQGARVPNILMFICSIPGSPSVRLSHYPPLYSLSSPLSPFLLSHVRSLSRYPFPLNEASKYMNSMEPG